MLAETITVNLTECARCGGFNFKLLKKPARDYSHWLPCPVTGEPVLLAIDDASYLSGQDLDEK